MSADYFLPPTPNTSQPDPEAKAAESVKYSNAGVDSGEIVIRGGSHLDFSWIPNPAFGASLRGADEIAWYTTAWFDKYVTTTSRSTPRLTVSERPQSGGELGPQLTAFFTRAPILFSSATVSSFSAKDVGHMAPSSRFALSLKPSVAYLDLNFCALWKKQTTLPSRA
jgi:hypothetical protein